MQSIPACPQCGMNHTYPDQELYICPDCAHEWPIVATHHDEEAKVVRDSNGTPLQDGDDVLLIKDLKVKGSSTNLKKGTKVRGIRIIDGDHDIACRINGTPYELKSEFLKKA